MPRALRVRSSNDNELGAVEALAFDPGATIARQIGPVGALGDDALKAMLADGPPESLAVASLMLAVDDPNGRVVQECRQPVLAFEKREARHVLAVKLEKVEGEIDQSAIAGVGGLLHQFEGGHAIFAHAAKLAVEIGRFHRKLRESRSGRRIFGRPVEAGSCEELNLSASDARGHPVAVKLDLVDPIGAGRRLLDKFRELRRNPS